MEENMNVNVGKKKKSIVPILFIIILILLIVSGVLLYDKMNKNDTNDVNNKVNNEENISNNNVGNVESNVNNNQEVTNTPNNKQNDEAIDNVYEKIGNENWASKGANNKDNLFSINNGEIFYSNGSIKNHKINFIQSKVKYLETVVNGGAPNSLVLITEENQAYKITFNGGLDLGGIPDQSKFITTKIELGEKIIDITVVGGEGVLPYSGPYYLTESGKLLTEDGKSYEEINKNHIYRIGSLGQSVYINKDKTLDALRVYETYEYITVVDRNGKKVRATSVFYESSERWSGTTQDHFYAVDENNKLLHFYEGSLMVADEYYEAKGKNVSITEYNQNASKIEIFFTDGTSIIIDKVYHYKEL